MKQRLKLKQMVLSKLFQISISHKQSTDRSKNSKQTQTEVFYEYSFSLKRQEKKITYFA